MGHVRLGMTYFDTEEEFMEAVMERERLRASMGLDSRATN